MKNLAGQKRWIILKQFPRKQDRNPKLQPKDANGGQEELRLARIRNEEMIFAVDEIVIPGTGEYQNHIFSVDNADKWMAKTGPELDYMIKGGYVRELPYSREEIDNLKKNWQKDPNFDLYEFPGADEYWDELKTFQETEQKLWRIEHDAINKIAVQVASLPVYGTAVFGKEQDNAKNSVSAVPSINYELLLISHIAIRDSNPKACIEQAKELIFEIAKHQYSLQTKESKQNDRRKLGPKKQSTASSS